TRPAHFERAKRRIPQTEARLHCSLSSRTRCYHPRLWLLPPGSTIALLRVPLLHPFAMARFAVRARRPCAQATSGRQPGRLAPARLEPPHHAAPAPRPLQSVGPPPWLRLAREPHRRALCLPLVGRVRRPGLGGIAPPLRHIRPPKQSCNLGR